MEQVQQKTLTLFFPPVRCIYQYILLYTALTKEIMYLTTSKIRQNLLGRVWGGGGGNRDVQVGSLLRVVYKQIGKWGCSSHISHILVSPSVHTSVYTDIYRLYIDVWIETKRIVPRSNLIGPFLLNPPHRSKTLQSTQTFCGL